MAGDGAADFACFRRFGSVGCQRFPDLDWEIPNCRAILAGVMPALKAPARQRPFRSYFSFRLPFSMLGALGCGAGAGLRVMLTSSVSTWPPKLVTFDDMIGAGRPSRRVGMSRPDGEPLAGARPAAT